MNSSPSSARRSPKPRSSRSKRVQTRGASDITSFARLARRLGDPGRSEKDPFAHGLRAELGLCDLTQFIPILAVLLHRLPYRQRAILKRYDLNREPLPLLLNDLAISRRQFFRDRRRGLERLLALFPPMRSDCDAPAIAASRAVGAAVCPAHERLSLERSAIIGLRNAGAADVAVARLQALLLGLSRPERRDILLEISEIAMEYGDRQSIRKIIADIRENGLDALEADEISSARLLSLEADLAETSRKRRLECSRGRESLAPRCETTRGALLHWP